MPDALTADDLGLEEVTPKMAQAANSFANVCKYTTTALAALVRAKAEAPAVLVGLDRVPGAATPPTQSDRRWLRRFETWRKADDALRRLSQNDTVDLREQIVDTAIATGLFSIWWTVFAADGNMRSRLRAAFRRT